MIRRNDGNDIGWTDLSGVCDGASDPFDETLGKSSFFHLLKQLPEILSVVVNVIARAHTLIIQEKR